MAERGYTMAKDDYLKRLRRIEGQVRGLQRMVDNDEYCIDILTQVSAVTKALQSVAVGLLDQHLRHCVTNAATKALQSVAVGLLDEHLRHCVADAARAGEPGQAEALISEATHAIDRLVKS